MVDTEALLRAMEYAATFGFAVWLQPQDYWLSRNGIAHEGEVASRLGLAGIPVAAETIAIAAILDPATKPTDLVRPGEALKPFLPLLHLLHRALWHLQPNNAPLRLEVSRGEYEVSTADEGAES